MRSTSVGLALIFLVCSMFFFSCASPSGSNKVREYSGELVLPSSVPHPLGRLLEARSYGNVVKVFASQGRIRLEVGQGDLLVILDSSTKEGRLFFNRRDPTKPESSAQREIREFTRLPPEGKNLVAFPQLIFWTFVALKFTLPPPDKPSDLCAVLKECCQKVGEEIIAGRATDKWVFRKSMEGTMADSCTVKLLPFLGPSRGFIGPDYVWIDKNLGIPIKREVDFELRNIVQARQDPSLFSFPEGYAEMR